MDSLPPPLPKVEFLDGTEVCTPDCLAPSHTPHQCVLPDIVREDPECARWLASARDSLALRIRAGIPRELPGTHSFNLDGEQFGSQWRGYHVYLVGTPVRADQIPENVPWSYYVPRGMNALQPSPVVFRLWYQKVTCEGSQVYGEVCWNPDLGRDKEYLGGLEQAPGARDIKAARKGLALLRSRVAPRGAPPGSGLFADAEEFENAVITAGVALHKQRKKVTQQTIADVFSEQSWYRSDRDPDLTCDVRRIREWCDRFERPWPLLKKKIRLVAKA